MKPHQALIETYTSVKSALQNKEHFNAGADKTPSATNKQYL